MVVVVLASADDSSEAACDWPYSEQMFSSVDTTSKTSSSSFRLFARGDCVALSRGSLACMATGYLVLELWADSLHDVVLGGGACGCGFLVLVQLTFYNLIINIQRE